MTRQQLNGNNIVEKELLTAERVNTAIANGAKEIVVAANATVTPSARDRAQEAGVGIVRQQKHLGPSTSEEHLPSADDMAKITKQVLLHMPDAAKMPAKLEELIRAAASVTMTQATIPKVASMAKPHSTLLSGGGGNPFERCLALCRKKQPRIMFGDSLDPRVLEAATRLQKEGLARPVLLADPESLQKAAAQAGISLRDMLCINHNAQDALERNASEYEALTAKSKRPVKGTEAKEAVGSGLIAGALMLARGDVDLGISGNISSTSEVIRAGLRILGIAQNSKTVFSVFFMLPPRGGQPLVFADCAVIPEPTPEQLADIAIGAARAQDLFSGVPPKVAMLSFSTHGSAKHPKADRVVQGLALAKERAPELDIDGELQFDAAVSLDVAAQKAPGGLEGKANVFVFPDIDSGNIGYKIAQRLGGYEALGPFLVGLSKPWHDLSRGCSAEDIYKIAITAGALL